MQSAAAQYVQDRMDETRLLVRDADAEMRRGLDQVHASWAEVHEMVANGTAAQQEVLVGSILSFVLITGHFSWDAHCEPLWDLIFGGG